MLYRVFIVCLFLILCIFLIYFALKNKQIETFQDTSKRIIVKNVTSSENNFNIFSYNDTNTIRHVNGTDNTFQAIFPDLTKSAPTPIIVKHDNIDGVIQIINVYLSGDTYKKITLKDTGTVYDGSTKIDGLSDIIQIAPNYEECFIALTSYNTLIHCENSSGNFSSSQIALDSNIITPNDPIVSIQGFIKSYVFLFLTMSGKLYKSNIQSTPIISTEIPDKIADKVIQFSIPTYSDYAETTTTPYSYIQLNDNTEMKTVAFNDGSTSSTKTVSSKGALTTVIIQNSTNNYDCYVVLNDKSLYKFVPDTIFGGNSGDGIAPLIDENIFNIIAVKETLYYIKSGDIYCHGLSGDGNNKVYFSHNNVCKTCGENADQQGNSDDCKCDINISDIKNSEHQTLANREELFKATVNQLGCLNYGDCPALVNTDCGHGLWYKQDALVNTKSVDDRVALSSTRCPACIKCSETAADAVLNGGVIKWGSSHPSKRGSPLDDNHPCVQGSSTAKDYNDAPCEYYISKPCSKSNDNVFSKKTIVNDLGESERLDDNDSPTGDFGKYISEQTNPSEQYDPGGILSRVVNNAESADKTNTVYDVKGTENGLPVTYNAGQDDTWLDCVKRTCCELDGNVKELSVPGSEDNYDCTKGRKRICNNCSYNYSCTPSISEDIFNTFFKLDGETEEKSLNYRLSTCGHASRDPVEMEVYNSIRSVPPSCTNPEAACPTEG